MTIVEPSTPHKASEVDVVPGGDVITLARAAIASCCDQVRLNTPGARNGEDPAFTHQLRVGARRLRVALKLFAALLEEGQLELLQTELKWVFSRLGAQRELDVLLRDTLVPLCERAPTEALNALRKAAEDERARRHETVQRALTGKRYARLLRVLDDLQTSLAERREPTTAARKFARKKLARRRESTLALYASALGGEPHQRHELRKEFKKLRYASELMSALFKPKRVKRYLAAIEEVQEVLGALNDAAAGRSEVELLSAGRHVELGSALEACEAEFASREAQELAKLQPMLREHAEAAPFWD